MKLFVVSDWHFYHNNIIKYCNRPFTDVLEMNEALIDNHNSVVNKNDHVYFLGDMTFGDTDIIYRLNGKIFMIRGNHDSYKITSKIKPRLEAIWDYNVLKHNKQRIVLFHYPIEVWYGKEKGTWHLHGHCHGAVSPNGRRLDTGVDSLHKYGFTPYFPAEFDQIHEFMKNQQCTG